MVLGGLITSAERWLADPKNEADLIDRPAAVLRRMQVQACTAALMEARLRVRGCSGPCGDAEQLLSEITAEALVPPLTREDEEA